MWRLTSASGYLLKLNQISGVKLTSFGGRDLLCHIYCPYSCACTNIKYTRVLRVFHSGSVEVLMSGYEEEVVEDVHSTFLSLYE